MAASRSHSAQKAVATGWLPTENKDLFLGRYHFRGKKHAHPLAFEPGLRLYLAVLFKSLGEPVEQLKAAILKHNGPPNELDVRLYFGAFFQKVNSVLELKVKVVIVGIRAEANFFDNDLRRVGLDLFLLFLLLVLELGVVNDPANGRYGIGRHLNKVKVLSLSHGLRLVGFIDALLYVFTDHPYFAGQDALVNFVRFFNHATGWSALG